jgi:hypothetical protein
VAGKMRENKVSSKISASMLEKTVFRERNSIWSSGKEIVFDDETNVLQSEPGT